MIVVVVDVVFVDVVVSGHELVGDSNQSLSFSLPGPTTRPRMTHAHDLVKTKIETISLISSQVRG